MWPSLCQPSLRHGVIAIALVGCAGLAVAVLGDRGASEDAAMMDETTGSITGSLVTGDIVTGDVVAGDLVTGNLDAFFGPVRARRAALPLSDEQRGHIFDLVMRIPNAPVAEATPPELADALPSEVALQDLPAGVTRDIPLVQGHKFVKFDDRILVVNSTSRLVVAMIPRYKLLP
jgi:hypothetical protein